MLKNQLETLTNNINVLDFDTPFTIDTDNARINLVDVMSPNITINDELELESSTSRFTPLSGMSNQHGYTGSIMHPSEVISSGITERLVKFTEKSSTKPIFIITEVIDENDMDNLVGWCIISNVSHELLNE